MKVATDQFGTKHAVLKPFIVLYHIDFQRHIYGFHFIISYVYEAKNIQFHWTRPDAYNEEILVTNWVGTVHNSNANSCMRCSV